MGTAGWRGGTFRPGGKNPRAATALRNGNADLNGILAAHKHSQGRVCFCLPRGSHVHAPELQKHPYELAESF